MLQQKGKGEVEAQGLMFLKTEYSPTYKYYILYNCFMVSLY